MSGIRPDRFPEFARYWINQNSIVLFEHFPVRLARPRRNREQRRGLPEGRCQPLRLGCAIDFEYIGIETANVTVGHFKIVTIPFTGCE